MADRLLGRLSAGDDLSALDASGFQPTQKRISAGAVNDLRAGIRAGAPFWAAPAHSDDPVEASPSGAIKDGHHRLAAVLLEGVDPAALPSGTIRTVPEGEILFPARSWREVAVIP